MSSLNPLATLFLVAMCIVVCRGSARSAVMAMLATAALIPLGQQIVVLGLHFHFFRILILVALVRVVARRDAAGFRMEKIDKLLLYWVLVGFCCDVLHGPSAETFGTVYNSLGTYFLFRILMRDAADTESHFRLLAWVGIAVGACMVWEVVTHRNPFYVMGGVPEFTIQRGDRFRCQGPFRHAILAGTFGATLFPLMVGLWFQDRRAKWLALAGAIGAVTITVASASSGPLLTFVGAIVGVGLWPMRRRMKLFRRGLVALVLGLSLVMKAPVWYLIAKVSDLVGGGGWHRAYLIDQFVNHFSEWWLVGTQNTAHWAPAGIVLEIDPNMMDITNHYVAQGIEGGLLMLVLFVSILVLSFKIVGRTIRAEAEQPLVPKLLWALGVTLASHCVAFISVSYFDQIYVFWFWLVAAIAALPSMVAANPAPESGEAIDGTVAFGMEDA